MNQNQQDTFLGTQPIGRLLFRLAVPTVIAQLVNMLYNIVDRIYIGHMPVGGTLALTGLGLCTPVILIVSAFAALVSSGGAPRASIFMGKGDRESAEQALGGCFMLQLILSAVLTAILLANNRALLLAFGASANTIDYAVQYMNVYALGTVFVQLTLGMNAFITAQGFAREGMLTVLIGAVCNIALDPVFFFHWILASAARRLPQFCRRVCRASGFCISSAEKRRFCGCAQRISLLRRASSCHVWRLVLRCSSCRPVKASSPSASILR